MRPTAPAMYEFRWHLNGTLQNLDSGLWTGPWTGPWTGLVMTISSFLLGALNGHRAKDA